MPSSGFCSSVVFLFATFILSSAMLPRALAAGQSDGGIYYLEIPDQEYRGYMIHQRGFPLGGRAEHLFGPARSIGIGLHLTLPLVRYELKSEGYNWMHTLDIWYFPVFPRISFGPQLVNGLIRASVFLEGGFQVTQENAFYGLSYKDEQHGGIFWIHGVALSFCPISSRDQKGPVRVGLLVEYLRSRMSYPVFDDNPAIEMIRGGLAFTGEW